MTLQTFTADDLYCATRLYLVLCDPNSSPAQLLIAEKWEREVFYTLPAELRDKARLTANAIREQRFVGCL